MPLNQSRPLRRVAWHAARPIASLVVDVASVGAGLLDEVVHAHGERLRHLEVESSGGRADVAQVRQLLSRLPAPVRSLRLPSTKTWSRGRLVVELPALECFAAC